MSKRFCLVCGTQLGNQNKGNTCRSCRRICACGRHKDYRAAECASCGMSRKAKRQWQEIGDKMRERLAVAGRNRRHGFVDLGKFSWQRKKDGRYYNWYWDEFGRKRIAYRYQWVWIMAHGPIPPEHAIHHLNGDMGDDRLENLQLLSASEHRKLHGAENHRRSIQQMAQWTCHYCGKTFSRYPRGRNGIRKYCSVDCYHRAQRSLISQ